jgi:hypothetical protein
LSIWSQCIGRIGSVHFPLTGELYSCGYLDKAVTMVFPRIVLWKFATCKFRDSSKSRFRILCAFNLTAGPGFPPYSPTRHHVRNRRWWTICTSCNLRERPLHLHFFKSHKKRRKAIGMVLSSTRSCCCDYIRRIWGRRSLLSRRRQLSFDQPWVPVRPDYSHRAF